MELGSNVSGLELWDSQKKSHKLEELCKGLPLVLIFYPGDFTPVCTKQMCEYRDNYSELKGLGVRLVGVSADNETEHDKFKNKFQLPFELFTDKQWKTAKALGCTSKWMLGAVSRGICIIKLDKSGIARLTFREVEKLAITRMSASRLKEVILLK